MNGSRFTSFALRCAFVYVVLLGLPFPVIDPTVTLADSIGRVWQAVLLGTGLVDARIYDPTPPVAGDPIGLPLMVLLVIPALALGGLWTIVDRHRTDVSRIQAWFRVYLRFFLAGQMFDYAFIKFFGVQFSPALIPSLDQLAAPYGDSSPIGVLWKFMAHSRGYLFFAAAVELGAGVLLLWPRTVLLGALLAAAALTNVLVLDLAFDVSVRLWAGYLLATAILLILPHLRQLVDFFVLGRQSGPMVSSPLFSDARANRLVAGLGAVYALTLFATSAIVTYDDSYVHGTSNRYTNALYGIWDVASFSRNRGEVPPLATDSTRWRRFIVERTGWVTVRLMTDTPRYYGPMGLDSVGHQVTLTPTRAPLLTAPLSEPALRPADTVPVTLAYERGGDDRLVLKGRLGSDSVEMLLVRFDESRFRLNRMRFRWLVDQIIIR